MTSCFLDDTPHFAPEEVELSGIAPLEEELPEALLTQSELQRKETAQWKDQAIQLMADIENIKKQAIKDIEEGRKFALVSFAKEMIAIPDLLEKALQAAEEMMHSEHLNQSEGSKALYEGVQMTLGQLCKTLQQFGIEKIECIGQKLDPYKHQALMTKESKDIEPGTIVEVLQNGYILHDRLLRPALVCVCEAPGSNA